MDEATNFALSPVNSASIARSIASAGTTSTAPACAALLRWPSLFVGGDFGLDGVLDFDELRPEQLDGGGGDAHRVVVGVAGDAGGADHGQPARHPAAGDAARDRHADA